MANTNIPQTALSGSQLLDSQRKKRYIIIALIIILVFIIIVGAFIYSITLESRLTGRAKGITQLYEGLLPPGVGLRTDYKCYTAWISKGGTRYCSTNFNHGDFGNGIYSPETLEKIYKVFEADGWKLEYTSTNNFHFSKKFHFGEECNFNAETDDNREFSNLNTGVESSEPANFRTRLYCQAPMVF